MILRARRVYNIVCISIVYKLSIHTLARVSLYIIVRTDGISATYACCIRFQLNVPEVHRCRASATLALILLRRSRPVYFIFISASHKSIFSSTRDIVKLKSSLTNDNKLRLCSRLIQ